MRSILFVIRDSQVTRGKKSYDTEQEVELKLKNVVF